MYPSLPQGRRLRAPTEGSCDRVPSITPLLSTCVSIEGYLMGLDGCEEFQVKSNQARGFGGLFYRDTMDDFRVLQFRDEKGKLHFITDIFPLCTQPDPEHNKECKDNNTSRRPPLPSHEFVKTNFFETVITEFKRSLSRIMRCRDDRFTPELIMEIVPRILTATASSLLKVSRLLLFYHTK
mgnify:CR=1 FL=1